MDDARRMMRTAAEGCHGLVLAREARARLGEPAVRNLLRQGELEWLVPGVLRVCGSARTREQDVAAAVLASGRRAALSHTSALAHWGVRGFVMDPLHVTRRRDVDDHKLRGVTIHEVRFLPSDQIRQLDGIGVVSPSLALLQIAGMTSITDGKLGRAIDASWSDRLVTYRTLTQIDERMSRQGRRGLTRFRAALEKRGPAYVPPASGLESRFADILERAGRAPMRPQVDVSGDDGWIGRVDFIDEDLPVIVEVQSARFHTSLTDRDDDARRLGRLRTAGYEVVEVTDDDLWHRGTEVLARVDAARARARTRRSA